MGDSENLEESLKGYRNQVAQINEVLKTADPLEKLELYDLEKDLLELIKITEENLLEIKKTELLSNPTVQEEVDSSQCPHRNTKTIAEPTRNESVSNEADFLEYVGTKCRVQYTQEWGSVQSHNAMVLSVNVDENDDSKEEDVTVRVLFLNPTHMSMVPCKYFMDGKCHYNEEDCKFSHGYEVNLEDLEEYKEPDFTQLSEGSKCLAKNDEDGVWYYATVCDIHDEQVTVSFDTRKKISTLDFHSILPILEEESFESSSESDSESTDSRCVVINFQSSSLKGRMGEWEEHTRGIGSKLMAKMGYIIGQGLGRDGEGRVEPVEITLLPPGKSLDRIAELREKGKIKDPTKRSRKKTKTQMEAGLMRKEKEESAFNLIDQLTHRKAVSQSSSTRQKAKFGVEDSYKLMKNDRNKQKHGDVRQKEKQTKNCLNLQMFKNSEKLSSLQKKLVKLKESLARNPGDTTVSRTIQHNINVTQNEINQLKHLENSIEQKINMKKNSKKLSIF